MCCCGNEYGNMAIVVDVHLGDRVVRECGYLNSYLGGRYQRHAGLAACVNSLF